MNAESVDSTRDLFDNPLGTDGFEFVEFTSPEPTRLKDLFEKMGFTAVSRHRSKNVLRFRQGDINFILNMEPSGQAAAFRDIHGPSANAMAFRVRDAAILEGFKAEDKVRYSIEKDGRDFIVTVLERSVGAQASAAAGGHDHSRHSHDARR